LPVDIFDGLTGLQGLDLSCNSLVALDLTRFDPFATTLRYLDISGNEFTMPPTDTALREKLTHAGLRLYTGANIECALPNDTGLRQLRISNAIEQQRHRAWGFEVPHDASTATITVTPRDSRARLEPYVASNRSPIYDNDPNTPGWQVDLPGPLNVFEWWVWSGNGMERRSYAIYVRRDNPPASEARLHGLELSGVPLIETFDRDIFAYTSTAPPEAAQTLVTPVLLDPDASAVIKLDGVVDADGAVSLAVGTTTITVEVTAEDGTTTRTYAVTVTRTRPQVFPGLDRLPVTPSLYNPGTHPPYCYIGEGNGQTEYIRYPDGRLAETTRQSDAIRSMFACD